MSLYGLTKAQLATRKAFCSAWGHDSEVLNIIGIGTINRCPRCGEELYVSPCRSDEPLVREQWEKDHAVGIQRWLGN